MGILITVKVSDVNSYAARMSTMRFALSADVGIERGFASGI